jgi:adenosylhomocysteine nucleosidase
MKSLHPPLDVPWIVFALRRESQPFCRHLGRGRRLPNTSARIFFPSTRHPPRSTPTGKRLLNTSARLFDSEELRVLVVETGLGTLQAEKSLADLFEATPRQRPPFVVSAGYSGALEASLSVGDVVVGTEVIDAHGGLWSTSWPARTVHEIHDVVVRRGRLFCSDRVVGECDEKKRLGGQHQALAVDMESAAVARFCGRHGISFGCVRAISDRADTRLSPLLASLLCREDVSLVRVGASFVRHPSIVREVFRLARDTRIAALQLARALNHLMFSGQKERGARDAGRGAREEGPRH